MSNRVTRGERILAKLVQNDVLTPQGRDFLLANLDPMHDAQLTSLSGWPDVESTASVVRCIKQTTNLQIPLGETGAWTAVIFTLPYFFLTNTGPLTEVTKSYNSLYGWNLFPPLSTMTPGHVMVALYTGAAANGPYTLTAAKEIISLDMDPSYLLDSNRLIGSGIEVCNTTSDLYKQGIVTVGRVPQRSFSDQSFVLSLPAAAPAPAATVYHSLCPTEKWPDTTADLMILTGSRQWPAKEGSYVVEAFCGQDNPPIQESYNGILLPDATSNVGADIGTPARCYAYRPTWDATSSTYQNTNPLLPVKTHSACMIYSGLSEQTTLVLNWNAYLESFPDYSQPSIAVLAKPSCVYDAMALHMLSESLNQLPTGVRFGDNPAGEWFWDVISKIANVATPFLAAVPGYGPGLALVSQGVSAGARSLSEYSAAQSPQGGRKKKKRNKAPPLPPRDYVVKGKKGAKRGGKG